MSIYTHVTSAHMQEAMQGTGVGKGHPQEPEDEGAAEAEVELLTLVPTASRSAQMNEGAGPMRGRLIDLLDSFARQPPQPISHRLIENPASSKRKRGI